MEQESKTLARMVAAATNIVAFTGAGISTASGIPDFRSAGGVFDRVSGRRYSGEEALSAPFFERNPVLFYRNFRETLYFPQAVPNFGHVFFRKLEGLGKDVTVVTQNIDNLHEMAGSSKVLALHGDATRWVTADSRQVVANAEIRTDEAGMVVDGAGNQLRPDIVLYGELLDQQTIADALAAIAAADLLIVVGTSLLVSPANSFVEVFRGAGAVLINQTAVPDMGRFDLVVHTKSALFLERVWHMIEKGDFDAD